MKQRLSFYILYFCLSLNLSVFANDPIRALIVTGGHSFDRSAVFNMFDSFKDFSYTEAIQPKGNILIQEGGAAAFDVLIFYDMYDSITEDQKEAYIKLLRKGKPVIFLHHALVSYQHWPEFFDIIGGKFVRGDTTNGGSVYKHDVTIPIQIAPGNHKITLGLRTLPYLTRLMEIA